MKRKTLGIAVSVLLLAVTGDCLAEVLYTKYNLHYQGRAGRDGEDLIASYANYVGDSPGHGFIPANTAVELGRWRGGFLVKVVEGGKRILFECKEENMRMSVQEYQKLIFSSEETSFEALSDADREGIKTGTVTDGMSKDGVKTAWGYPARHRTPSLAENRWTYWRNRFATIAVEFEDGKVVNVKR